MSKQRIGFIGVGFMGHGMAKNILEKGFPLTIMGNRNRAPVEDLVGRGANEVKSPREVAANSDIVFICVTDSPTVEKIIRDTDGVKAGAHKGLIIVDCSTANPVSTAALAAELAELGVDFADAPLGGTPAQDQRNALPKTFETAVQPPARCATHAPGSRRFVIEDIKKHHRALCRGGAQRGVIGKAKIMPQPKQDWGFHGLDYASPGHRIKVSITSP